MRYMTLRHQFLKSLGELTDEQRSKAIEAFDRTLMAQNARFCDAWDELTHQLKRTFFPWLI